MGELVQIHYYENCPTERDEKIVRVFSVFQSESSAKGIWANGKLIESTQHGYQPVKQGPCMSTAYHTMLIANFNCLQPRKLQVQ